MAYLCLLLLTFLQRRLLLRLVEIHAFQPLRQQGNEKHVGEWGHVSARCGGAPLSAVCVRVCVWRRRYLAELELLIVEVLLHRGLVLGSLLVALLLLLHHAPLSRKGSI